MNLQIQTQCQRRRNTIQNQMMRQIFFTTIWYWFRSNIRFRRQINDVSSFIRRRRFFEFEDSTNERQNRVFVWIHWFKHLRKVFNEMWQWRDYLQIQQNIVWVETIIQTLIQTFVRISSVKIKFQFFRCESKHIRHQSWFQESHHYHMNWWHQDFCSQQDHRN